MGSHDFFTKKQKQSLKNHIKISHIFHTTFIKYLLQLSYVYKKNHKKGT